MKIYVIDPIRCNCFVPRCRSSTRWKFLSLSTKLGPKSISPKYWDSSILSTILRSDRIAQRGYDKRSFCCAKYWKMREVNELKHAESAQIYAVSARIRAESAWIVQILHKLKSICIIPKSCFLQFSQKLQSVSKNCLEGDSMTLMHCTHCKDVK